VSKAPDDHPRASDDPTRGPKGGDVKKPVEGATPHRMRATGPRERSGPIGISSGDFATPVVRKRTTTQPRGVPVVGAKVPAPSLDEPVTASAPPVDAAADVATDEFENAVTPAPELDPPATSTGAMPETAVDAVAAAMPIRPPPPPPSADESPFGGDEPPPRVDRDVEAAALAAEAAAVRALDPGPLTPPPDILSSAEAPAVEIPDAPTPPPEVAVAPNTPPPEAAAAPTTPPPVVAMTSTPPPVVATTRTPRPDVAATPPPQVVDASRTPPPEITVMRTPPAELVTAPKEASEITVMRTPPPELVAATRTPLPEMLSRQTPAPAAAEERTHDGSSDHSSPIAAAAAAAAAESAQVTPPPDLQPMTLASGTNGAAPGAAAVDPDAGFAALPAEALSEGDAPAVLGADAEVDGDEHVEMVEGDANDEDGVIVSPAAQARSLRNAAPPPIPGSHLRTPGPEALPRIEPAGGAPPIPAIPILPEAITQRPRRPKRSKPWFEEVFDEDYLRTLPFMRADQTLREVEFISDALRLGPGAEILDIACGYGRHAIELVQRGYSVTGLDLSLPLLLRAADEAKRRALSVNFVHADMREMAFEKQFDGAYSMLTSFGYFDEDTNLRVAERIGRALKPGARFLLDVVNRDYVVSDLPVRVWWEGTGCVVLEEVDFNFHTSRIVTHRSIVFEDGRQLEQEISVRAYSLHEIGRLLRQAGFRVIDVSGGLNTKGQFFGNVSRSLLIVAEKRESETAQPL
jgi:SAM-dependent methyltransferase